MAYRWELAIQDALTDRFLDEVDDKILSIFYLYEKSPEKLTELRVNKQIFLIT